MKVVGALLIVALVLGVGYSVVQLGRDARPVGSENLIGEPPPEFAAPLASSGIEADSNITTRRIAQQGGGKAACDVKVPGAFVSCRDLKSQAVIIFWSLSKPACLKQVDELQKAFSRDTTVSAVAVSFNDEIEDVARTAREHGWTIPVPVDRDGATSIVYSVAGCPSIYFIRDGAIAGVRLATLDAAALRREFKSLVGKPQAQAE